MQMKIEMKKNKLWKFSYRVFVKMRSFKKVIRLPLIIYRANKRHQTLSGDIFSFGQSPDNLGTNSEKIRAGGAWSLSSICLMKRRRILRLV